MYELMGLYTCVPCFISYLDQWLHANSANCTFQRSSSKRKASCPSDRGRLAVLDFGEECGTGFKDPTFNYRESFLGGQRECSGSKDGE